MRAEICFSFFSWHCQNPNPGMCLFSDWEMGFDDWAEKLKGNSMTM